MLVSRFAIEKFFIYMFNSSSRPTAKNKASWFSSLPRSAEIYLKNVASVNIHNHVQTGSSEFKDD